MFSDVDDKTRQDCKYPTRKPGESDKDYKKRSNIRQKQLKAEAKRRHSLVTEKFIRGLRLDWEPVLRSVRQEAITPYFCNQIAHTRLICIDDAVRLYDNTKSMNAARQARNHDGYKLPHQLITAERFGYKPCLLVHAFVPSCIIKDKRSHLYFKVNALRKQLKEGRTEVLEDLRQAENERATGCFTSAEFLHYRFWFFDLDYTVHVPFEDIAAGLDEVGLFEYLAAAVETSPGKYHLYFHSPMIAAQRHVEKWRDPPGKPYKDIMYYDGFVDSLKNENPLSYEWQQVAHRGLLDKSNLQDSPIPLLSNPTSNYYGDDALHDLFKSTWHTFNRFVGGDPKVHNETRIAQLPFYTNPKNGYEAQLLHVNKNAPVLSVNTVREAFRPMVAYYKRNGRTLNPDPPDYNLPEKKRKTETPEAPKTAENKEKATTSDKKPKEPIITTRKKEIPDGPKAYALENAADSQIVIKWEKDITNHSNEMLFCLAKYAWRYIDLTDPDQRRKYYDKVIYPYFKGRISKDLCKSDWEKRFYEKYEWCCRKNHKYYTKVILRQTPERTSSEVEALITATVAKAIPKEKARKKYESLVNHMTEAIIENKIKAKKEDGALVYNFFVHAKVLRVKVNEYAKKLVALEELGVLVRDKQYFHPLRGWRANLGVPPGTKKCKWIALTIPADIVEQLEPVKTAPQPETETEVKPPPPPPKTEPVHPVYSTDPFAGVTSPEISKIQTKIAKVNRTIKTISETVSNHWKDHCEEHGYTPLVYVRKDIFRARYEAKEAGVDFMEYVHKNLPSRASAIQLIEHLDNKKLELKELEADLHLAKVAARNADPPPPKPDTPDWAALKKQLDDIAKS